MRRARRTNHLEIARYRHAVDLLDGVAEKYHQEKGTYAFALMIQDVYCLFGLLRSIFLKTDRTHTYNTPLDSSLKMIKNDISSFS